MVLDNQDRHRAKQASFEGIIKLQRIMHAACHEKVH
jgi:hypothetical protein